MTVVVYPAILDDSENKKDYFTVTFPDVPGAITDGQGEGKAMENGSEVLSLPSAGSRHQFFKNIN